MTYDPNDYRITAYAFGELEGQELADFELELSQSESLKQQVADTRQMVGVIREQLQQEPELGLSAPQRAHVRQAIAGKPTVELAKPTDPRLGWRMLLSVAAAACLVGLLSLYWMRPGLPLASNTGQLTDQAPSSAPSLRQNAPSAAAPRGLNEGLVESSRRLGAPATTAPAPDAQSPFAPGGSPGMAGGGGMGGAAGMREGLAAPSAEASSLRSGGAAYGLAPQRADAARPGIDNGALTRPSMPGGGNGPEAGYPAPAPHDESQPQPAQGMSVIPADPFSAPAPTTELQSELERKARDRDQLEDLVPQDSTIGGRYSAIVENEFQAVNVAGKERSTFAIDVDTASYTKVRQSLLLNTLPPADAVRIEELVNYFPYDYAPPVGEDADPFTSHLEVAECPWNPQHRLVRIGLKGRVVDPNARPATNLVFLLDVSGSMNQPNKLPLLKSAMQLLAAQLTENDIVSIVVYAGSSGLVLPPTPGDQQATILGALERLQAGGSTNGGAGIELAYRMAVENFIKGGVNRVILCTDGDFNVGISNTEALVALAEQKAKSGVFLSVLAFGMDNHNDAMLEQISNKGNGNYAFIDSLREARKVLVQGMVGTLMTIAKDVKVQVEFNPAQVAAYRLIGYENRVMANQDFRNDEKDAGEIGAGHTVTALYEVVPMESGATRTLDENANGEEGEPLRYQRGGVFTAEGRGKELLTFFVRYKQPDGDEASELSFPLQDQGQRFGQSSSDYRFAASVAAFGMLLRSSQYRGDITWDAILEIAQASASPDPDGHRAEFLELVERAKSLTQP